MKRKATSWRPQKSRPKNDRSLASSDRVKREAASLAGRRAALPAVLFFWRSHAGRVRRSPLHWTWNPCAHPPTRECRPPCPRRERERFGATAGAACSLLSPWSRISPPAPAGHCLRRQGSAKVRRPPIKKVRAAARSANISRASAAVAALTAPRRGQHPRRSRRSHRGAALARPRPSPVAAAMPKPLPSLKCRHRARRPARRAVGWPVSARRPAAAQLPCGSPPEKFARRRPCSAGFLT